MSKNSHGKSFLRTLGGGLAISALLMGVAAAGDLHTPHVGATNPGFSEGTCPLSQDGDYGWHFVAPGQSEFVSISVTFQNAGVITSFIADPTPKHAYVYTTGPDTLLGATAVLNPDEADARFVLSHVCNPDETTTTIPETTTTLPETTTTVPETTTTVPETTTTVPETTTTVPETTTTVPETTTTMPHSTTTAPETTTTAPQATTTVPQATTTVLQATTTSVLTAAVAPTAQLAVLGSTVERGQVSSLAVTGIDALQIMALGLGLSFVGLIVIRLAKR